MDQAGSRQGSRGRVNEAGGALAGSCQRSARTRACGSDGTPLVNRRLQALVDVTVGTSTLLIKDRDGTIVASNQDGLLGRLYPDDARFRAIRDGASPATLHVSPPFTTPLGRYAVSVGKRPVTPQGRFDGAIMAILDPAFSRTVLESVRYSDDMRASIIHGGGKIIASTDAAFDTRHVDLNAQPGSFFGKHMKAGVMPA